MELQLRGFFLPILSEIDEAVYHEIAESALAKQIRFPTFVNTPRFDCGEFSQVYSLHSGLQHIQSTQAGCSAGERYDA